MIKYVCNWTLERRSDQASGFDLRCARITNRTIEPGEIWLMPTSLFLEMPPGVEAQVRSRSGLALNHGVIVLNAPGTIDSDYRGEVGVTLINHGKHPFEVLPGMHIAQLVFAPVLGVTNTMGNVVCVTFEMEQVADVKMLRGTARGASGHGSTGL